MVNNLGSRTAALLSGSRLAPVPSRLSRGGTRRVTLTVFLLAMGLSVPTAARELQISFTPGAPTWRDGVVLTVSGSGSHCFPMLGEPTLTFVAGWQIDVDLIDECLIDPPFEGNFTASRTLDRLSPRVVTVRVHDLPDAGDVTLATLTIHPGADLEITTVEPASSDQPLRFELAGVGACPTAEVISAGDGVVRVRYNGNCAILPPGEVVFSLPLEAGPLPPGGYEIQVFDHTSGVEPLPVASAFVNVWDAARCVPTPTSHCLEQGRFRVEASFRDFQDRSGPATALPTALDDTGLFWFFLSDNVELTVKVLDGCGVNGRFWVFIASGSTVEYDVEVTDTESGQRQVYGNDLGELPELIADTRAFATCP